jgi:2-aminoadipate transaminase
VALYLGDHLEQRVHDIVQVYHQKRDTLLHALDTHFSGKATWTRPKGGMFLWLTLPPEIDTERYLDKAHGADVNFYPGVAFSPSKATGRNCMRLAYGYALRNTIAEGIKRLASVLPL